MNEQSLNIHVALAGREYNIHFCSILTKNNLVLLNKNKIKKYAKSIWLTNDTIYKLYHQFFSDNNVNEKNKNLVVIPDGEDFKNWQTLEMILSQFLKVKLDRKSLVFAVGGGVVGDLGGLAASLYQRGIAIIQIPTTLLAMVDSSIGGKTAVNHKLGKNMIGTFHQPSQVIIDLDFIKTLPNREFNAGMAEVIKYGLLGDREFYYWIIDNSEKIKQLDAKVITEMISKCCQMKAQIVEKDETEKSERALLNLGHTFGHAIEAITKYQKFLHGEAIAIGILMAARYSQIINNISEQEFISIKKLLQTFNLPTSWQHGLSRTDFVRQMMAAIAYDKKKITGNIRLIFLEKIGKAMIYSDVDNALIEQSMIDICPE